MRVAPPNDPSSTTRPAGRVDCNRGASVRFAAAQQVRPHVSTQFLCAPHLGTSAAGDGVAKSLTLISVPPGKNSEIIRQTKMHATPSRPSTPTHGRGKNDSHDIVLWKKPMASTSRTVATLVMVMPPSGLGVVCSPPCSRYATSSSALT